MKRLLKAAGAPRCAAAPFLSCIALFLTLVCVAAPGQAQNLVANGGFENPQAQAPVTLFPQGQNLGGWVVETGSVELVRSEIWQPQEGNQSVDLAGNAAAGGAGTIYQDIETVPGQMYRLRFFLAGNPGGGDPTKQLDVLWNGKSLGRQHFDAAGFTPTNMGWGQRDFFVTATGNVTRLTIQGVSGPDYGAVIDNVTVTATAPWSASALSTGADNRTRLLWRHSSGVLSFWTLSPNGKPEAIEEYGPYAGFTPSFVATGADNRSRLLWTNPSGVASLWSLSPLGLFENFVEHGPYPDWSPVALSAGADNLTRLLWEHMTGAVSLHLLSPTGVFQRYEQHGPFPGWKATAMGTGGDNRTRLLWTHGESGTVSLHTLSPNGVFEMHSAFGPYPGWTAALLDVGKSDNRTRLVWRHTSGAISFWTMSPEGQQEGFREYGPYPGWTATAISVGEDNRTRLVWTHDTGAISLWLIAPNGEQERNVQFGPFF